MPCQDSSRTAELVSADGLPVGLMAVADGHGNKRYWLSDVGSRLACELAVAMAAKDLAQKHLSDTSPEQRKAIRSWLADDLAVRLVSAWEQAIEADWQEREVPEEHQDEPFSRQTYGSTLALVVLTPYWWAHTGLGDWDLVLLSNDQPDQILSQEGNQGLHGEATKSLCLPHASRCFTARTSVYYLRSDQSQGYGLVLSTDGIRKSCATDTDHLTLSRYLLEEAQAHQVKIFGVTEQLDTSLDRISREGSGDDVSVALAWFGILEPMASARAEGISIPTPPPEPPPLPPLPVTKSELEQAKSIMPSMQIHQASGAKKARLPHFWKVMAAAGVVCVAIMAWIQPQDLRPPLAPATQRASDSLQLTTTQVKNINLEIKRLCEKNPLQIQSILIQRKDLAKKHQMNTERIQRFLTDHDWLGSLILKSSNRSNSPNTTTKLCPDLSKAMQSYWQEHPKESPQL